MNLFSDEEKAHLQHQHFGRLATSGKTGPVLASAPTIFMLNEFRHTERDQGRRPAHIGSADAVGERVRDEPHPPQERQDDGHECTGANDHRPQEWRAAISTCRRSSCTASNGLRRGSASSVKPRGSASMRSRPTVNCRSFAWHRDSADPISPVLASGAGGRQRAVGLLTVRLPRLGQQRLQLMLLGHGEPGQHLLVDRCHRTFCTCE